MRTIIHSSEAVTASSRLAGSSLTCWVVARGVAPAGPQIYSINFCHLHYALYECFALSVSVHYAYGGCAMHGIAMYSFD